MKQSSLDLNLSNKKTRKREFLFEMDRVVPWAALVELITPHYPEGKNGRPPFALETMLRVRPQEALLCSSSSKINNYHRISKGHFDENSGLCQ